MTTPGPDDGTVPVTELSYTEASRELDAIVGFFEQREVDVDQLVVRLERATAIVDELDRRVRQTRAQVEELVPRLEAAGRVADDAGGQAGDDDEDVDDLDDSAVHERIDAIGDPLESTDDEGDEPALF